MTRTRVLIAGAAGRDFHNFNLVYRGREEFQVVGFTATQIPNIDGRVYPAELAGELYPDGIPIWPEADLERAIARHAVDEVVFAYSDVTHEHVMPLASRALAAGASYRLLSPRQTMLTSSKPVVAVCAVRTGSGKSQTTRHVAALLRDDGNLVFAGIDYAAILDRAEQEADVILWDGGNNDTPFIKPNVHIVVVDPHRPGHELRYHPGETNLRMADVCVVNKVERVLAIEDGPTLTHGEMTYGAVVLAAKQHGAAELVDPRPFAVGSIAETFAQYPSVGTLLPAMGYGRRQMQDLRKTIARSDADLVLIGTPIDLRRLIDLDKPAMRVTAAEQLANVRETVAAIRPLFDGPLVVTHGNGPQVGNELLRQERAADEAPPLPLWLAVAQTQAEIGALIAAELRGLVDRPVACVVTHVRVDEDDPAFEEPTKPIGPFYSQAQAERLERERGWRIVADAGRGYRRVVPSPQPLEIVELEPIETLLEAGALAIACGGGGVPVVARDGQLRGVDAVIDKDWASALLATALGAERLVILTAADAVYRDFGGPAQEAIDALGSDEAEALLPE